MTDHETRLTVALFSLKQEARYHPDEGAIHIVRLLVPDDADWARVWWGMPGSPAGITEYVAFGRPTVAPPPMKVGPYGGV